MTQNQAIRYCERYNRPKRNVKMTSSIDMNRFWNNATGNLVLMADNTYRDDMLISRIITDISTLYSDDCIVVLHNSNNFEMKARERISKSGLSNFKLVSTSDSYANYDFLYKMSPDYIVDFFANCAANKKMNVSTEFRGYLSAVLNIMKDAKISTHLYNMEKVFRKTDKDIVDLGKKVHSDSEIIRKVEFSGVGSKECREIFTSIRNAFKELKDSKKSGYNIITRRFSGDSNPANVMLIKMDSYDEFIINNYFSYEIKQLLRRKNVRLYINNIGMTDPNAQNSCDDELLKTALKAGNKDGCVVGFAGKDIYSLIHDRKYVEGFPVVVFDSYGQAEKTSVDMAEICGRFQGKVPTFTGAARGLEAILGGANGWTIADDYIPRVQLEDFVSHRFLLMGDNGVGIKMASSISF